MACHDQQSDDLVFFVNGKKVIERQADPGELLLYYLRKKLRLSGTKYGCGVGGCGACTVMLSTYDPVAKKIRHHPANSCLLPICSLHGAAVTTVEGVGSIKNRINPIQEMEYGAWKFSLTYCHAGIISQSPQHRPVHSCFVAWQFSEGIGKNKEHCSVSIITPAWHLASSLRTTCCLCCGEACQMPWLPVWLLHSWNGDVHICFTEKPCETFHGTDNFCTGW
ncbi:aldehyde oxidase 3-like [Numida meleagris]|uniref:aldehyde oxidase 3-like n=1 Tax=Numida meleagris TaxID=8996 RepID=UPI000B3DD8B5|nr:aldehyde oxidase 3-like [Numida meleagris]